MPFHDVPFQIETLDTYVHDLQQQVANAHFTLPLAAQYWQDIELLTRKSTSRLEEVRQRLRPLTNEQRLVLEDLIYISRETLKWSEENELSYAEALSEAGQIFFEHVEEADLLLSRPAARPAAQLPSPANGTHYLFSVSGAMYSPMQSGTSIGTVWYASALTSGWSQDAPRVERAHALVQPRKAQIVNGSVRAEHMRHSASLPPGWVPRVPGVEMSTPALGRGFILSA